MSVAQSVIVSIDPGLHGAVAWLCPTTGALLAVQDMPVATAKSGKSMKAHIIPAALAGLLSQPQFPDPDMVVIEEVGAMPGQGVTSMFRFGFAAGVISGVVAGLGLPITYMRPQAWQKIAGVREGKDAGRIRACQLWPEKSAYFQRVKDHNRADAALIGYAYLHK